MTIRARSLASGPARLSLALLASGVLGAGVGVAAFDHPADKPSPPPVTVKEVAAKAVTKPVAPARAVVSAPQPVNQTFRATLVSGTADTVTVQGLGSIDGTPDVTIVSLQVSLVRETSGEAMDASSTVVSKVFASLRHHGVAQADIQSTGLTLSATYDYHENSPPTLTGYQAGQTISATLRSERTRGATISAVTAVSPGDVTINGLSYDLEHDAALLTAAQRQAFAAARTKAKEYADLAGRSLGRVMTIREATTQPGAEPPVGYAGTGGLAAAPAEVPLASGSQTVGVSVTVTWALR